MAILGDSNHGRASLRRAALAGIGIGLFAAGCGPVKRSYQPEQDHGAMSGAEFINFIAGLSMVNMDEAYHAMLLLADGEDSSGSFEAREQTLLQRGVVRNSWNLSADDALDRGTMAYMLVKVLKLPTALNDVVLGAWGPGDRRYALRRAVWQGIVPYGLPYQVVTGGELVTALTNAEKYMVKEGILVLE